VPRKPVPEEHPFGGFPGGISVLKINHIGSQDLVETKLEMSVLGIRDP
jgi:hypothetical protein